MIPSLPVDAALLSLNTHSRSHQSS